MVGQEVADRLLNAQMVNEAPSSRSGVEPHKKLSGIDLQIGGEGMKGFYDKMLPDYLNTYGKPYGAQVQLNAYQLDLPKEARTVPLHTFPITPEMRESIKQKGLPLYQQVGIPTVGTGAASQMVEQKAPEQEEPEYSKGGSIAKQAALAKLKQMRGEMAPRAEAIKNIIARDQNSYLRDVVPNSLTNPEIEAEIQRMAAKAPMIMKPSALTELRKIVQQEKGDYGSRRLERAADEIPNLERMYSDRGLREVFTGDNARALMTMNPADFEKFAMPLVVKTDQYLSTPVLNSRIKARSADKLDMPTDEYVKYLMDIDRFDDVPFLTINKEEQGLPLMPFISGHEGRHRNRSLTGRGEQSGLVQLLPRAELREPFPRRSQQEYIDALKQELEMTGNKVEPEKYRLDLGGYDSDFIRRPPIQLPDIYAKGGAVKPKVKDSKSGKVRMTENRDTMFMELSNKKLKRK
jgi:hypothetical protein